VSGFIHFYIQAEASASKSLNEYVPFEEITSKKSVRTIQLFKKKKL